MNFERAIDSYLSLHVMYYICFDGSRCYNSQNLKLFHDCPMKAYRKFFSDMSASLLHEDGLKSEAGHS